MPPKKKPTKKSKEPNEPEDSEEFDEELEEEEEEEDDEYEYEDLDSDNESVDYEVDSDEEGDNNDEEDDEIIIEEDAVDDTLNIRIPDEDRVSAKRLSKYELTAIIGKRVTQLQDSAMPLIKNYYELENYEEIAKEELKNGMIPFKIKRVIPFKGYEIWRVDELGFSHLNL